MTEIDSTWYVFKAIEPYSNGLEINPFSYEAGMVGYVKRNGFQPDFLQLLIKQGSSIVGVYERIDERTLEILKPAPAERTEELWSKYWSTKYG